MLVLLQDKRENQMKRILKLFVKILGGLAGLIVLGGAAILAIGYFRFYKTYDLNVSALEIPADEVSVARGKHLVEAVAHCAYCHGPGLAGNIVVNADATGIVVAPNLTSGKGGLGAFYTADDWVRAIHHGVTHKGRSVIIMPSLSFDAIGAEDLAAIIAYLQTIPPVDNVLPETKLGPVAYAMVGMGPFAEAMSALHIDHNAPLSSTPAEGETAEYGAYLVEIGQCRLCHGTELSGGRVTPSSPIGPNLTPGGEPGFWTEEQFFTVLRTGIHPSGRELNPVMPWKYFAKMTNTELQAVWAYLQSLPKLETVIP
jgi:mono/diheme cytochrome c family protein